MKILRANLAPQKVGLKMSLQNVDKEIHAQKIFRTRLLAYSLWL